MTRLLQNGTFRAAVILIISLLLLLVLLRLAKESQRQEVFEGYAYAQHFSVLDFTRGNTL